MSTRPHKPQKMKTDQTLPPEEKDADKLEASGGRVPRLVSRYSEGGKGDPERMLEMMLRDLWGNHPEWPSTFGRCSTPNCDGSGRGSGPCSKCVRAALGMLVGNGPAESMLRAIQDVRATAAKLREFVSPANAIALAPPPQRLASKKDVPGG